MELLHWESEKQNDKFTSPQINQLTQQWDTDFIGICFQVRLIGTFDKTKHILHNYLRKFFIIENSNWKPPCIMFNWHDMNWLDQLAHVT